MSTCEQLATASLDPELAVPVRSPRAARVPSASRRAAVPAVDDSRLQAPEPPSSSHPTAAPAAPLQRRRNADRDADTATLVVSHQVAPLTAQLARALGSTAAPLPAIP